MIGRTISHYRIESELGRGGMGVVYRAHDERLRRDVALKILPDEISSHAERRGRILSEARAASALNHPGITTIYEVGEEGEQLFIVMELVTGQTLRAILANGPLEPKSLARLGAEAAEALHAAHSHGVIHGDIKPENIILLPDGRLKLLDFGIARQTADETRTLAQSALPTPASADSKIAGTLAYMAPEQFRAQPTDARTDLYSLGVVLYELATARRPFPGPTASALISQVLHEPAPRLSESGGRIVPAELARIIHKLLEKEPVSRYQSARELQVDLTNLVRDLELGTLLPPAVAGKRSVAVLPFKLLTPNPEDEYLGVALADAVINQLTASGDLLVRPTSTVQRYAKQPVDPPLAARELNVQVIVDGSIQKLGQKLRAHVQAWNAADGSSLFSAKQDSDMADLFGLQDRIADGLARALGVRVALPSKAPATPPTSNTMAYELFLRAAERLSRLNRWDTRTAIEMLEDATQLDPTFAAAWARLADACIIMGSGFDASPIWFKRADQAIRKALSLDKNNAEAHCARGRILWTPARKFQNRPALHALGQALRLNPGYHPALTWQCLIFMHVGLLQEAKEGLAVALATHPDDAFVLDFIGQTAGYLGNYEEAEEYFARALAIDPANLWANVFYPVATLYRNDLEQASAKIRTASQVLPNDSWLKSCEALLWAKRGEPRKAEQAIRRALKGEKPLLHIHHLWHNAAAVFASIGRPAEAITWLRRASKNGLPCYPAFRDDPHFLSLRNRPQYLRILADLKREWEGYRRDFGHGTSS